MGAIIAPRWFLPAHPTSRLVQGADKYGALLHMIRADPKSPGQTWPDSYPQGTDEKFATLLAELDALEFARQPYGDTRP